MLPAEIQAQMKYPLQSALKTVDFKCERQKSDKGEASVLRFFATRAAANSRSEFLC
jgi:hypothetical protein